MDVDLDENLNQFANILKDKIKNSLKDYDIASADKIYENININIVKDGIEIDAPNIESIEYGNKPKPFLRSAIFEFLNEIRE